MLSNKCCPYCKSTEIKVYNPSEIFGKLGKFNCCYCKEDFMKPIIKDITKDKESVVLSHATLPIKYYHYSNLPNIEFLDAINNSNMIFLCHNKVEWYNAYPVNEYDNNLFQFISKTITDKNTVLFNNLEEYHSLWNVDGDDEDETKPRDYSYGDRLKKLISQGYICFKLDVENLDSELSELFVINPASNLTLLASTLLHEDYTKWVTKLEEESNECRNTKT